MPHTGRRPTRLAHRRDDVAERGGVAGAVGQEEEVGVRGQQLVGGHRAGVQRDLRAAGDEVADDRALDAGVDRVDPRRRRCRAPSTRCGRDHAGEVLAGHRRLGRDERAGLGLGHRAAEDAAAHRARRADVADERARVHAGDRRARRSRVSQSSQPRSAVGASSAFVAARMIAARAQTRSDSIASALAP